MADENQRPCTECGAWTEPEHMIDCTECRQWFCDNCYDTGLGDGCHCHRAPTTSIIFDGYRANPEDPDTRVHIVCTRVVVDKYQHHDTYIIHGMEQASDFGVADFLLEYCAVAINGIARNTGRECSDDCPFYCGAVAPCRNGNCTAKQGFQAAPIELAQINHGTWIVEQDWHREVI